MGKILNAEYGGIHATYWMAYAVISSFASAYLLDRGYTNSEIGLILAVGSIVAVFLQPFMADFADRAKKISLLPCTCNMFRLIACRGYKDEAMQINGKYIAASCH